VASNAPKTALPQQRSRGQSRHVETTIIVGDGGNENAQIILTSLPKTTASSTSIQRIVKTVSPPSTSVSQSTSGVMTGAKLLPIFNSNSFSFHSHATSDFLSFTLQLCRFTVFLWFFRFAYTKTFFSTRATFMFANNS
jgi:hypothetical protein